MTKQAERKIGLCVVCGVEPRRKGYTPGYIGYALDTPKPGELTRLRCTACRGKGYVVLSGKKGSL